MKSAIKRLLPWFLLLLNFGLPVGAQTTTPAPPELEARGYLLVDFHTGKALAELNADERVEPASLTKIMTAYTVFRELASGRISLSDRVTISERAWRTGGSKMFIEVGKQVSLEDLLKGMIIQSGNDASVALAEYVSGNVESFANLMNAHAKRLGMTNSHFTNPNGLPDPELYTTARDMARVAAALIREFPEYYAWYSTLEFTYNGITQQNRNPLLRRDPTADGIKTGYTKAAGYCLIGSAKRDDMRLISVVMGAPTPRARAEASLALLNYGFRTYESHKLYPVGQPIQNLRVWFGEQETLPAGPERDVVATIPRGQYAKLSARIEKTSDMNAPIARGERLGDIVVLMGEEEITRIPLIALQDLPKGGLWRQVKDSVLRMF
ncbi:D-alanyl-D-alanine carboxypeptidase family protein [Thermochromatium tepidum]|uniref:serine-type D-Ala-D-Ala carboxypeptidase n=1 Tax=Thermochromatium tepidum ATCC 43061 TaxID=316276 RepID=A0A6I6E0B9_THETI|nr:D-alanyl-D-alanine carboxypeptidase family protein [Thermochromatium tepidum]QGU33421.1 serine hydrolase [Thermochromatium tepidum ATCC 43061]